MTAGHRLRSTGNQVRVKIPVKTCRRTRCGRNCGQQVWATQSSLVRGRRVAPSPWRTPGLPQCGSPVDDSDAHAEYKQVTVLFADVVHSMDIASVVGAERLGEIMAALVDRAAVVVQRYEGAVGEFTGDEIMAVLGGRP
jgi:hypothetical protein